MKERMRNSNAESEKSAIDSFFRPWKWTRWCICRATIHLEPKISTAEENLILLPKKKKIFLFARLTSDHIVCLIIFRNHLLQQFLIPDFLVVIVTENVFSLAYFLNQLNVKPSLENQFPKNS